jgi:hypothetical protein
MSEQGSGIRIVRSYEDVMFIHCEYGHGSFKCDSYVSITHDGAFHFCTYPATHGFSLTLKEVLEAAKEQGPQIEKQVRNYTDQLRKTNSLDGVIQKALPGEPLEQAGIV